MHAQIQWFWRALRSFDQADRARFLQFVTGTSKVPLQGFAFLEGMNGIQKFQIHRDDRSTDRLPSAHTWYVLWTLTNPRFSTDSFRGRPKLFISFFGIVLPVFLRCTLCLVPSASVVIQCLRANKHHLYIHVVQTISVCHSSSPSWLIPAILWALPFSSLISL